ncbi:hypothetical protein QBC35DRAFT_59767 [Podospora australis]|uniref:2EXR domain-containing protein n=1 Tax=Podospora australis TaxID=1536484 RepID=A0AAN6WQ50_9PEZI|nr:hypothetical protein QBC35DRAFT_59767 [Podospora australis]
MVLNSCSDVVAEISRLKLGITAPEVLSETAKELKPSATDREPVGASPKPTMLSVVELPPTPTFSLLHATTEVEPKPNLVETTLSTPLVCTSQEEIEGETFRYFPLLPPELRLKIWHLSFLPRTVELHTRRTHYADRDDLDNWGNTPKWRSSSINPAALSVNTEGRCAALEHYTISLRLAAPISRQQTVEFQGQTIELPSVLYTLSDRVLHISPEHDTVVLLGDLHYTRLKNLLDWFREQDPAGRSKKHAERVGLRKIAMSAAPWAHAVGAATLRAFARTLFADIDEFVLFRYPERAPPLEWGGGRCVLRKADAEQDCFMGFAKQFMDSEHGGGGRWMRVGRGEMKVADISFEEGWQ